jgi:hypothetical protein
MKERVSSVVALAISVSLAASGVAQSPGGRPSLAPTKADVPANEEKFECDKNNSKVQASRHASNKHTVTLSWNASVSLSTPPAEGDGYNLYRFNPADRSCTKINESPIRNTSTKDESVEPGQTYFYAARAVKQNRESKPSNVTEVLIPSK